MAPVRLPTPHVNKQPFMFQAVTAVTNLVLTDFLVLCCRITNARETHCGGSPQCLTWVNSGLQTMSASRPLSPQEQRESEHSSSSHLCQYALARPCGARWRCEITLRIGPFLGPNSIISRLPKANVACKKESGLRGRLFPRYELFFQFWIR